MIYKLFMSDEEISKLDELSISVVPYEPRFADEVRALILSILPTHFDGVNDAWVDSLFAGWDRRESRDVNQKYKLIFVATEGGRVVGVVGATPKKGEPIKLMPLVAAYPAAFTALLSDVPQYLREFGHKLYTHIVPSVEQVIILQRKGWTLDCMLPAAYRDEYTTQQWSYNYGETNMRNMRVKAQFYRQIKSGKKTLEVRVGYDGIKKIQAGEVILLETHNEGMQIRVKAVRVYQTFAEMLAHEDASRIAPEMGKSELLSLLKKFYPPFKEKLGVYVLEVEPEKTQ
jgi:ASC-1-like (ASCH) protein